MTITSNRRAFWSMSATVLLVVAMLAGCSTGTRGSNTAPDNELIVGRTGAINGLEGDTCQDPASIQTNPMIYGTLLTNTADGLGLQGGLASGYDYDPARPAYTLHLRTDAAFSNGKPLTAADVVFSIAQWRAGATSGSYYSMIADQRAVDDNTVLIILNRRDTFLPALLTWCTSTVYPDNFAGQPREQYFRHPIGAGPFQLMSWDNPGPSETLTLRRNPGWYNAAHGQPTLDTIIIRASADSAQQLLAFQAGELDLVERIGSDAATQIESTQVRPTPPTQAWELMVNSRRPALSDPGVRRALSLAINRADLASVQDGYATPAVGVLPTNVPNSVPASTGYHHDPAHARELLRRVGQAPITLRLGFEGSTSTLSNVAELIRNQLAAVGFNIVLQPTDQATVGTLADSGDFDLLISSVSAISPTVFDPVSYLIAAWYPRTGANLSVVNTSYTAGATTFDNTIRDHATRDIQNDALTQNTVIGLYNLSAVYAVAPYVHGFAPLQYLVWDPATVSVAHNQG